MAKKLFTILLFALFSFNIQGQIIKMRTTEASHKIGEGNWSNWEKFETLVIVNGDLKNITIYSEPKEVYEIISKKDPNKELGIVVSFNCVDKEGEECIVEIRNDEQKKLYQLYIRYDNAIMAINLNPI